MKHMRTDALGAFPRTAAVALAVVFPCAVMLHLAGEIHGAIGAIAAGAVGVIGIYGVVNLYAWAGMYVAERSLAGLSSLASGRGIETPQPLF